MIYLAVFQKLGKKVQFMTLATHSENLALYWNEDILLRWCCSINNSLIFTERNYVISDRDMIFVLFYLTYKYQKILTIYIIMLSFLTLRAMFYKTNTIASSHWLCGFSQRVCVWGGYIFFKFLCIFRFIFDK